MRIFEILTEYKIICRADSLTATRPNAIVPYWIYNNDKRPCQQLQKNLTAIP